MRRSIMPAVVRQIAFCGAVVAGVSAFADMGWAQYRGPNISRPTPSTPTRGAPAPLLGLGLPAVGGAILALALARRLRRKD
jgi:hypothetical protein